MSVTTTDTDSLLSLEVPSPWTKLQAGQGTVPGVSVETDEHIRMYAKGTTSASDAVAQATGQIWLQAIDDVVTMAAGKSLIGSRGNTFVAANEGVTVMAGFSPSPILSWVDPVTFPQGVEGYETSANIVGGVWTGFTVALGIAAAAAKVTETCVGNNFTWWQSTSAVINVVGAGLNLAALGWSKDIRFPGINLWSQGGTLIGSTFSSVNVMGVGGVIMASPFTSTFAMWSTKMRAIKRVGMTSCKAVAIAGTFGGSTRSVLKTAISARTGSCKLMGAAMEIGTKNRVASPWPLVAPFGKPPLPNPQMITQSVMFSALTSVTVAALGTMRLECKGLLGIKSTAGTNTEIIGNTSVTLGTGTASISIGPANGITMADEMALAGPQIVISAQGVQIDVGGGSATIDATIAGGVSLRSFANEVKIVPGVSLAVNGTEVAIG